MKLDECGELYCGQSLMAAEVNSEGRGHPYFTGPEQWDGQKLHIEKWTEHPKRLVPDGCIFITVKGAGVGKLFPGVAGAIGRDIYAFRVHAGLNFNYILYALIHSIADVVGHAQGDIPGLSRSHILDHRIFLPGAGEQGRVVAKIEELFSELDSAVESLTVAQEQLRTYRQALLKYAFEGKLTADWRASNVHKLEAPEVVLARISARSRPNVHPEIIGGPRPLPRGWAYFRVSSLCEVVRGGSPRPAGDPRYYGGSIPFLKVADLTRSSGPRLYSHTYTIKEAGLGKTRTTPPQTLLISNSGATLGVPKICMFETSFNDGIAAFLGLSPDELLYHYYFWESQTRALRTIDQGAAQPNLNTSIIGEVLIPICSPEESAALVDRVSSLLSESDSISDEIEKQLIFTGTLRQSVLKQAFSGQLVPQDSKDEPASALLERIRAERNAAASTANSTRKRPRAKTA